MSLTAVIDHPYASALAWSLVHFLWQGAVLALAAFILLRRLNPTASTRYFIGVATLAVMLAAPVVTFALIASGEPAQAPLIIAKSASVSPDSATSGSSLAASGADAPATSSRPSGELAVLVAWLAGVTVLSLRLFGGWIVARRLVTRAVGPVAPEIHALARVVAGRLALDRIVHVLQSSAVRVPVMVGWLKPVVLLPAAAMSGLTIHQIEALLAHELAHVRRHDYLVNLLQSIVETLLFYHPAVWWMSRQVRADREHCCDDVAIGVCDRLVYVSALTDLAGIAARPALALAATDGSLIRRVRRILGSGRDEHEKAPGWSPILLVVIALAVVPIILASGRLPVTGASLEAQGLEAQGGGSVGVPGGMPSGVPGGVAGGVPGGVIGGVPGGVVGGVPGGIPGGVPGGVTGGGQGGVVVGLFSGDPQTVQDLQGREQAAAAQLRELEQALDRLKDERMALTLRQSENEARAQIAFLEAELKAMKEQQARTRRLFETGLANDSTVAEVDGKVSVLEQRLATARNEREFRAAQIELERRELQQMREYDRHQADYEKLRMELAERLAKQQFVLEQKLVSDQELKAKAELRLTEKQRDELAEAHRQYEKLLADARLKTSTELLMPGDRRFAELQLIESSIEITAPNETVRPGDILSIEISDEPDLPRAYIVQGDGTVKLPLIGSVRVQSLTTAKVRDEVARRLDDLRIKGRTVEVRLRRSR